MPPSPRQDRAPLIGWVGGPGGGGGHSGSEWLPTDKRQCGVEAVNAKI